MKREFSRNNPYGDDKVIEACGLFGILDTSGRRFPGTDAIRGIANMHDRSNGLGGGFAVYGLYPDYADHYAFHVMYMADGARGQVEAFLGESFRVVHAEEVPTRPTPGIVDPPLVWRYFLSVPVERKPRGQSDDDYVIEKVMAINTQVEEAFVLSSGKDMGVFKGVGYPEDIGRLLPPRGVLRLPVDGPRPLPYQHARLVGRRPPLQHPGLDGGAQRRDLVLRHQPPLPGDVRLSLHHAHGHRGSGLRRRPADAPPRPAHRGAGRCPRRTAVERDRAACRPTARRYCALLRQVYGSLLLNGPFTVIIAHQGEMIGLTDRIRLRPLTAAVKGDVLYLSSEEAAIRLVCPDVERAWIPVGGEPVVGRLKTPAREAVAA